jgi:hypothetical protein
MSDKIFSKHFESSALVLADAKTVFAFADDHNNFSSHMNQSSWMMAGSHMETLLDDGHGQQIGSHIRMTGKVLGIPIFLDEVVVTHQPPYMKTWEAVDSLRLLVVGNYRMGFEIVEKGDNSLLRVFIDYDLPVTNAWLGILLGGIYAKWCVKQMIVGVQNNFA